MAIVAVNKARPYVDFRLEGGSHAMHVSLAPHVWSVRPGTPLKPSPLGWEVSQEHKDTRAFAVTHGRGGAKVHARASATFDVGRDLFGLGDVLSIADIDDTGFVTFVKDDAGPFYAESASKVHMSV
jgi:hypothetical protein